MVWSGFGSVFGRGFVRVVCGLGCVGWWRHVVCFPEVVCFSFGVDAMGHGVVSWAQELTVLGVGVASVGPVDDVVCVAPRCGYVASLRDTSTVTQVECSAQSRWDGAGTPSDVDWLGAGSVMMRTMPASQAHRFRVSVSMAYPSTSGSCLLFPARTSHGTVTVMCGFSPPDVSTVVLWSSQNWWIPIVASA